MKVFAKVSMLHSLTHTNTHHRINLCCSLYCITVFIFILLQMCDIGDASRGSLSSYAYTLMVLFFLQQRNPPVIPVLQEVQITRLKLELSFFLFKFEFPYLHIWMLPNTVVAFSYLRVSFCSDKQWNVSNRTNANVNKYKMLILPSTSTSLHWPFLFQIYDGKKKPEVLVDGWNVYFFDDLKTLVSVFFISHTCFSEFACNGIFY